MNTIDTQYFILLKEAIAKVFLEKYSASTLIENWKGEDIIAFQEDLFSKVKMKVSEKWFYTYFKNDIKKLPRIDMLNMLSKYVGFLNWNDFKNANKRTIPASKKNTLKKFLWLLPIIPIIIIASMSFKNEFQFCFVDESNQITTIPLNITILQKNESPLYLKTDSTGCFTYKTKEKLITFIVKSPYHKTDTIVRSIDSNNNKTVKLLTDDYALMLHYYSNGNVNDWKKRKAQLEQLFDDDAQIYQLFSNNIGIELFSKEEFIRKLTTPTSSLKNIKIIDKSYKNGKIVKLKFIVK